MYPVREIVESEFESEVLHATEPVLVDFYAPWCGPCRMLAPVLEKLAAAFAGRIKFVKVNVDDAPRLATQYGIRGVPTLMLMRGGLILDEMVGLPDPQTLRRRLEQFAPSVAANATGAGTSKS